MNSKWYRELELTPGADKEEVRKAFRRLAKKYHPDLNKAPDAPAKFIRIRQAHDHLMNPEKFRRVNFTSSHNTYSGKSKNKSRKEERERRKQRAEERRRKAAAERQARNEEAMRKICEVFKYAIALILTYNLFIVADFFLPAKKSEEEIVAIYEITVRKGGRHSTSRRHDHDRIHFSSGRTMKVDQCDAHISDKASLTSTLFLDYITSADIHTDETVITLKPAYGRYDFYWFLMPLIIILSTIFYLIKNHETRLKLGILIIFIGFVGWFLM